MEAASQLLYLYPELVFCLDSSMVEHAAVNRGVAGSSPARGARQRSRCYIHGSVVKRLRHRPFTAVTRVRFPSESLKTVFAHVNAFYKSGDCDSVFNILFGPLAQLVRAPGS